MNVMRKAGTSILLTGSLLLTGGALAGPASAAPVQDGLVNVAVGDISLLNNTNVNVVAKVVAQICGVKVGPVAVLARAVDRSGATATVCTVEDGPVVISNNNPG